MAALIRLMALVVGGMAFMAGSASAVVTLGGNEMGNGGHAVQCLQNDGRITWEVLDVYETQAGDRRNWEVRLEELPGSFLEKAQQAFERLEQVSPTRYIRYRAALAHYSNALVFVPNWPPILGSNPYQVGGNCRLHLAAAQRREDSYYNTLFISTEIWDRLDENNKAALLIHEVVYWEALRHGHDLSSAARYLTAMIISNEVSKYDRVMFEAVLAQLIMNEDQWRDVMSGRVYQLDATTFTRVDKAVKYCKSKFMHLLSFDDSMSESFERFVESYVGKRSFYRKLLKSFLVMGKYGPFLMTYDGIAPRVVSSVDDGESFSVLCVNDFTGFEEGN